MGDWSQANANRVPNVRPELSARGDSSARLVKKMSYGEPVSRRPPRTRRKTPRTTLSGDNNRCARSPKLPDLAGACSFDASHLRTPCLMPTCRKDIGPTRARSRSTQRQVALRMRGQARRREPSHRVPFPRVFFLRRYLNTPTPSGYTYWKCPFARAQGSGHDNGKPENEAVGGAPRESQAPSLRPPRRSPAGPPSVRCRKCCATRTSA
jgi:hypothetical protein